MIAKQLKDILRSERPNLHRMFGVVRLIRVKEGQDEFTIVVEIADQKPLNGDEIAAYLEVVLGMKVKVITKYVSQSKSGE